MSRWRVNEPVHVENHTSRGRIDADFAAGETIVVDDPTRADYDARVELLAHLAELDLEPPIVERLDDTQPPAPATSDPVTQAPAVTPDPDAAEPADAAAPSTPEPAADAGEQQERD